MKNKYETIKHKFTPEFIQYLRKTVGSRIPETGLIGGSSDGYHTDKAYFDSTANVSGSTYTPDKEAVDAVLALWNNENTSISVVAHSHPRGCVSHGSPTMTLMARRKHTCSSYPALRNEQKCSLALPLQRAFQIMKNLQCVFFSYP